MPFADTSYWRGPSTLYVDPDVEFGGNRVGGIGVKPLTLNLYPAVT